jgi:hypothetical protein
MAEPRPTREPGAMTQRRSIRSLAAAALAGAALTLALSAAGPTASASADNWNRRADYLRFPAPVNFTRCKIRHLRLNGSYTWLIYHQYSPDPSGHPYRTRTVKLHGRYRWLDCLHTYAPPGILNYYMHRSWIRNERTGGEVLFRLDVSEDGYGTGDGRYEWGSRLIHR